MGRFVRILNRLERVLEFSEFALRERVAAPADAEALERHRAFRWQASEGAGRLVPIASPELFDLADLIGVERALARLVANTERFLAGHPAQHVLLYGERGTGKSSAVRGLLQRFGAQGLRIVEIRKRDMFELAALGDALRDAPQRFLLFCDDLSFSADEPGFRELKAALDGRLVGLPENCRVVATSNRRQLLAQTLADNQGARLDAAGELHVGESLDEKLALADRFGLTLGFYPFDQATYLRIVDHYARRAGLRSPPEEIRRRALRWALDRSSRSGRSARHFVDELAGEEASAAGASAGA